MHMRAGRAWCGWAGRGGRTLTTPHMDTAMTQPHQGYINHPIHTPPTIMHPVCIHLKSTCSCPIYWEHSAHCPTADYCYQTITELLSSGATLGFEDDYTEYERTVCSNASHLDQSNSQHNELDIIHDSTIQDCYTTSTPVHTDRICETTTNKQTTRRSKANAPQPSCSSGTNDTTHQSLSTTTTCSEQTLPSDITDEHLQPSTSTSNTKPSTSNSKDNAINNNLARTNRRKCLRGVIRFRILRCNK
jgi:hypothetical protein